MAVWFLIDVLMLLTLCPPSYHACPNKCNCGDNKKVSCEGAGLTKVPYDLPPEMIELNFTGNRLQYLGELLGVINRNQYKNCLKRIFRSGFNRQLSLAFYYFYF